MPTAFLLSLRQLGDPAILRVWIGSMLLTLLLFMGAGWAIRGWVAASDACLGIGATELCARDLSGVGSVLLVLAGLWLLFPAVAIGVMGVFADTVVAAVERRHYPAAAARAVPPGWGRAGAMGLRSAGRLIGYNLLAAPFYILLIVTGAGPFLLALAVNAVALARDLWEMVAARHMSSVAIRGALGESRWSRLGVGLATAGLFAFPVVNLLAPVLGAAMATHMYHRRRT